MTHSRKYGINSLLHILPFLDVMHFHRAEFLAFPVDPAGIAELVPSKAANANRGARLLCPVLLLLPLFFLRFRHFNQPNSLLYSATLLIPKRLINFRLPFGA